MSNITNYDFSSVSLCVDWLSGYLPIDNVRYFFDELNKISDKLNISRFEFSNRGYVNYRNRFDFSDFGHIIVAFNPIEDGKLYPNVLQWVSADLIQDFYLGSEVCERYNGVSMTATLNHHNIGIYVAFSGDILAYLRSVNKFDYFINFLKVNDFHCSRMDFAFDFHKQDELFNLFYRAFSNALVTDDIISFQSCISRFDINHNFKPSSLKINYSPLSCMYNYTLGSHSLSSGMVRLYDKILEKYTNKEVTSLEGFLYRLEIECHNRNSYKFFYEFANKGYSVFADVLYKFFRVVDCTCKNLSDNEMNDLYKMFIEYVQKNYFVQLSEFFPEVTPRSKLSYIRKQSKVCSASIMMLYNFIRSGNREQIEFAREWLYEGVTKVNNDVFLPVSDIDVDKLISIFMLYDYFVEKE